jgi:hypothetical protein
MYRLIKIRSSVYFRFNVSLSKFKIFQKLFAKCMYNIYNMFTFAIAFIATKRHRRRRTTRSCYDFGFKNN